MTRYSLRGLLLAGALAALPLTAATAQDELPGRLGEDDVTIALVRYLSTGDFFRAYLAGVECHAEALGIDLRVFDSRQDAALQRKMLEQAIGLGGDGIILQHGLTETLKDGAQLALDAGIPVVAFDVNVENPEIPQIEQNDRELARLALEQVVKDHGTEFKAGYVYVAGIAPLDRRDETWQEFKGRYPGIDEVARRGTLSNPIVNSVADQTAAVLRANPDVEVVFAPYDEFAKGVKIAVDEAGLSGDIDIYSVDISTADIAAMREPGSAWVATAATNPSVVGEVSVHGIAMLLAGEDPGQQVFVPPTLITRDMLLELDIASMEDLQAKLPQFAHVDVLVPDWMPLPPR